jgi:hypothetical protein
MVKRVENGYLNLRKFAMGLRELAEALPSEAEKATIRRHLDEIVSFLSQTQKALDALPSREGLVDVRRAIQAFDELATLAKSNPAIAAALSLPQPRVSRSKITPLTEEENTIARALLEQLQSLTIDDMNARLEVEESISTRQLNALAGLVGIKATRRTPRDELVHQLVTRISNFRGYRELKGESGDS